jgi:hypothetical protein
MSPVVSPALSPGWVPKGIPRGLPWGVPLGVPPRGVLGDQGPGQVEAGNVGWNLEAQWVCACDSVSVWVSDMNMGGVEKGDGWDVLFHSLRSTRDQLKSASMVDAAMILRASSSGPISKLISGSTNMLKSYRLFTLTL